ncbi:hypothetical protein AB0L13_22005 [Saccharopolyspora shandongensis]
MNAAVAVTALVASPNQCPVSNSTATCRRSSAECTALPSVNMISLRGQK